MILLSLEHQAKLSMSHSQDALFLPSTQQLYSCTITVVEIICISDKSYAAHVKIIDSRDHSFSACYSTWILDRHSRHFRTERIEELSILFEHLRPLMRAQLR